MTIEEGRENNIAKAQNYLERRVVKFLALLNRKWLLTPERWDNATTVYIDAEFKKYLAGEQYGD